MELIDNSGIRYVLGDKALEIYKGPKKGYEYHEIVTCYPGEVEDSVFNTCTLKISIPPKKIEIRVKRERRQELVLFADELDKKGKDLCTGSTIKNYQTVTPSVSISLAQKSTFDSEKECQQEILEIKDKKGGFFTKIKCPKCHSLNFSPIDTKKKFSIGKSLAGNTVGFALAGPVGGIVGAATGIKGKNGKTKFVCNNCGKVWEQKV